MSEVRIQRLSEAIKEEVADILRWELKDPRVGFCSVVGVELSRDLRHAKVRVSVYGEDAEKAATVQSLHKAAGYIRTELGRRIRMRHVPELTFKLDESIEHGVRVIELLEKLKQGDGEGTGKE